MSADLFNDATQEPYPSDSEAESQADSVFDIGTQFQNYSPRPYLELGTELDRSSRVLGSPPGGRPASGHRVAGPEGSSPAAGIGGSAEAHSTTSLKQNLAPGPEVIDTENSSVEAIQGPKPSPGRKINYFTPTQPIESPDSDDDVIFVSSRPRTTPASEAPRIKEEPKDQGDVWSRFSAVVATGSESGSGGSASSCTVEGDGTQRDLPVQVDTPSLAKEISRPRFVPKGDVVKRIQANLLKKNMENATLGARLGTSTVPAVRLGEHSGSQTGAGKSLLTNSNARGTPPEIVMVDDDLGNDWMNQDIEEEDGDSDAYERLKGVLEKTNSGPARLQLEVELIAAENMKSLRDRRRHLRSSNMEIEASQRESLFVQDFAENVHKQRKRAHEASLRYQTPYTVGPDEIEGFDIESTSMAAKRSRTDGSGLEGQPTRQTMTGTGDGPDGVPTPTETRRPAGADLERAQANEGGSTEDIQASLLQAISQSRSSQKQKRRPPRAKTAKEVHSRKAAKGSKAIKAGKSPKASPGILGGKVTKSGAKPSKTAKASKKASRHKSTDCRGGLGDGGEDLLHSLFFTDAIALRQAQKDYGEAPVIEEKSHKDRMLKELMASIPKDHKRLVTNDKTQVLKASKNFGYGRVKACEGKWLLKGMISPLYHHQLLGADWMVKRELSSTEKGGILADAMGLGKTLQMLAVMVGNAPDSGTKCRTTLLVVPSSVIDQWQNEILTHVEKNFFNHVLHYKRSKEIPLSILETCDVIITSYAEVVASCPLPSPAKADDLGMLKITEELRRSWTERGLLHSMKFHRVVLDESHVIKNHRSRTSVACYMLNAEYRWALSGTPIHNRIEEIFPYFRFLRVQYTTDFYHFRKEFCDPDSEECNTRLLTLLGTLMIRRTLKDKMFNRPIVELPQAHTSVKRIEFSKEERCLYEIIEDRFRTDFNAHLKEGTAVRNYRTMVVKLLRLRQLTAHPFLLQQTIQNILTLEDVRRLEAKLNEVQQMDKRPLYEKVGQWVRDHTKERREDGNEVGENDLEPEEESRRRAFGRSNFGSNFSLVKYLQTLDEKEMLTRCICSLCHDVAVDPQITDCFHVFCKSCIQEEATRSAQEENEVTACPACNIIYMTLTPWFDELAAKEHVASSASSTRAQDEGGSSKSEKNRSSWLNMEGELLPSAKTIALKAIILEWMAEAPNEKIVVFTQFRLMGKIIGKICKQEGESFELVVWQLTFLTGVYSTGWGICYFTGDMNSKARVAAVKSLNSNPNIRIMIAGLKCGGQGLNLTMACRVICIDLWWNHSVEQQAFGRVFRIGQANQTHLTRFVVRGTVDDRLLGMQVEKSKVVDGAMMDDGRILPQLSVEELASLFGYLSEDANGDKIILPDSARPIA
ncbi:MAG: hypothetical protein M1840_007037 [Geoglossum simile]|nr:MAG: hypothetical protein M1840_007037 [Geoglossum simile]